MPSWCSNSPPIGYRIQKVVVKNCTFAWLQTETICIESLEVKYRQTTLVPIFHTDPYLRASKVACTEQLDFFGDQIQIASCSKKQKGISRFFLWHDMWKTTCAHMEIICWSPRDSGVWVDAGAYFPYRSLSEGVKSGMYWATWFFRRSDTDCQLQREAVVCNISTYVNA